MANINGVLFDVAGNKIRLVSLPGGTSQEEGKARYKQLQSLLDCRIVTSSVLEILGQEVDIYADDNGLDWVYGTSSNYVGVVFPYPPYNGKQPLVHNILVVGTPSDEGEMTSIPEAVEQKLLSDFKSGKIRFITDVDA